MRYAHLNCLLSPDPVAAAAAAVRAQVSPRAALSQLLSFSRSHRTDRSAMANHPQGRLCGGVHDAPAGRENDLEAIELARFAVAEHNSKTNGMLEFERLVKVRQQVVAGTMHHFTLEVREGGAKKLYEAKVWEKLWENFKQLHSFEPVAETTAAA